ncbi:MAG: DUF262 domain-containing protein [Lachnospiraceae bacterium]|nr:DUF262 domain-containing protein [Lachnospiraceae bacterium]
MSELMLKSVYELLGKNYFIPSYQRGYRWEKRQVQDLLGDLYKFAKGKKESEDAFYCLQPIVVKKCDEKTIRENGLDSIMDNNVWYEVIDGQQRLTTLYVIFKYLIKKNNIDMRDDYKKDLFQIEYQTRVMNKDVINNPETIDRSSPNAFYITEAYRNISEWFDSFEKPKEVRNIIETLLLSDKSSNNDSGYVQVIWYETTDSDPIKIFTRLNIGKIPLRNAELIKALFLQKRDVNELSEIQQIQIAKEWDQIESVLQDKRVWAFLNSDVPNVPTHIEFIFDVIFKVEVEKEKLGKSEFDEKYGTDEYASFRFFSEKFENATREKIKEQWAVVREYYETFIEWYNNPLLYHYIGFLIYCKEPIINIYNLYKDKNKSEFLESLIDTIRKKLKVTLTVSGEIERNGIPIIYDNKTKETLKQLLILYNIEYIVQKNKSNDKSYIIFPFDLFKSEKWDIEHVDSFTTNPLVDKSQQREWLKTAIDDLNVFGVDYEASNILTPLEIQAIKSFLGEVDRDSSFDDIKSSVSKLAGEYLPSEEILKDIKNTIGNLTLLNADINRGYGNSIFPSKKKEITKKDAEGRFIPICTKNVFLKNFTGLNNTTINWSQDDMLKYRQNIIEVIKKFLIVES